MGHLFGRDAALEVLKNKQTIWTMSMGITWDNKESLSKILFLIGLPGSGKSTLSKYLSDYFGFSVISSNTILEEDKSLNGNY